MAIKAFLRVLLFGSLHICLQGCVLMPVMTGASAVIGAGNLYYNVKNAQYNAAGKEVSVITKECLYDNYISIQGKDVMLQEDKEKVAAHNYLFCQTCDPDKKLPVCNK